MLTLTPADHRAYLDALRRDPCTYCGLDQAEHHEHVVPRARGGGSGYSNLVGACAPCNARKGVASALGFVLQERLTLDGHAESAYGDDDAALALYDAADAARGVGR